MNITGLRNDIDALDDEILQRLVLRAGLAEQIAALKAEAGESTRDANREAEILDRLCAMDLGPVSADDVRHVWRAILSSSRRMMDKDRDLLVCEPRGRRPITVGALDLFKPYAETPELIAGPCAIEDAEIVSDTASALAKAGVRILRGGAFKPRTSPYSFQGLGEEGLGILAYAAREHGMACISEVLDTRTVEEVAWYVDIIQIGTRNMANFELLKEVGATGKPVLLKRGFAATVDEWIHSAEYLAVNGCNDIIMCERGIRTFSDASRFTIDFAAVAEVQARTWMPVVVDVSHAAGRRELVPPLFKAAIACGADGVMVEVHACPDRARCDSRQQLTPDAFADLVKGVHS